MAWVSVRIQLVHHPIRGAAGLGERRLLDLCSRPAEVVPDLVGEVYQSADDGKRAVRCVDDPPDQVWVPKYCHATTDGK
ncbi:MAG: hypothetical protein ABIS06_14020 [Vicinamibacterales bacterium]